MKTFKVHFKNFAYFFLPKITENFDFTLPTVGQNPKYILPRYAAFEVETSQLLSVLREIEFKASTYDGVYVEQIYDFWAMGIVLNIS